MKNIVCFLLLIIGHLFPLEIYSQSLFNVSYSFDNLHRLTQETYSNGLVVQYTYDILGNRTTKVTSGNPCAIPSTSFTSVSNNLVVNFTNTTVNGTTYSWAFGNGQTSTLSNPSVTYASAGTYQVCLTATNGCGSQQFCQQVTVTNCVVPTAGFTRTTNFLSATFTNTSTGATSYLWNFGDGGTSTQANPGHTYTSAGTYNVCLTATNACGSNQTCQQVTVANCALPISGFTQVTNNLQVTFSNTSTGATTYAWNFGNGQTSTLASPSVTYSSAGTYNVCLTATNGCGSQQYCQQVTVVSCVLPTAAFTQSANNLQVTFSNTSTGATSYAWNFGNGQTSTLASPSITYAAAGTYNICLTATNGCGSQQYCQQVTVTSCVPPTASFTQSVNNLNVVFMNTSTNATSYLWDLGNGQTATISSFLYIYSVPGTYTVCLTVTNACGTSQSCQQVTVSSPCVATIDAGVDQTMCMGGLGVSIGSAAQPGYSYSWSPSTGLSAPTASISTATPTATTLYTLTATKPGCPNVTDQVLVTVGTANSRLYVNKNIVGGNGSGSSWANAISEVGEAIWIAQMTGCVNEIWVANGTYLPTRDPFGATLPLDPRTKTFFLRNNLALYGGFSGVETSIGQRNLQVNSTILSGDLGGSIYEDNAYHVVMSVKDTTAMIFDGFQVIKGCASENITSNIEGKTIDHRNAGGMYLVGSAITIRNCSFAENKNVLYGGGMLVSDGSNATILGCEFSNNLMIPSYPTLAMGGGLMNQASITNISSCTLKSNYAYYGGGIAADQGDVHTDKCTFADNSSYFMGAGYYSSNAFMNLTNSSFTGNSGHAGGGIFISNVLFFYSPVISNCTFFKNHSLFNGGGIYTNIYTPAIIDNCIIWGNGPNIYDQGTISTVRHSVVQGGYPGNNNMSSYPDFMDTLDFDGPDNILRTIDDGLMISTCSPAIDAGNPSINLAIDIVGNARYDVPGIGSWPIDIGAYERQAGQVVMPSIAGPVTICPSSSIVLSASGGGNYLWNTGSTSAAITVTAAGNYSVTSTDNHGCVLVASHNVTALPSPIAAISGSNVVCSGVPVNLIASGGNSYVWNTGATTPSIVVGSIGTVSVTVTGNNGCTATASSVITSGASPSASISGPTTVCSGSNVTLTAAGGTSYLWSNGATTSNISVGVAGTYSVTVTNASGCSASTSQSLTVNQLPSAAISGQSSICNGTTAILTATGGTSYLWSTGATTPNITVGQAGNYSVTVTNAGGCTATATQAVTLNALPTPAIAGPTSVCSGTNATLTASGGTSYLWSNGATTPSISVGVAGNYSVTVTNANGCSAATTQSLTVNAAPTASITGPSTFCSGANALLTATGGNTYQWSTGATTSAITVNTPGTYVVTVTNALGCQATVFQTVTVNSLPTPSISGPSAICAGTTATLAAAGGTNYLWSTGATTPSISVSNGGSYTVTVTGINGCTSSTTANLSVNPLPTASINGNLSICQGTTTLLTASGGTSYAWNTGSTSPTITTGTAGSYTVTVTDASGCSATATQNVTVNALPNASISGNPAICTGGSTTLTASGGTSYQWNTGATSPGIAPTIPGTYTVTVTNANGCSSIASTVVTLNTSPTASITGLSSICDGANVFLTASGGIYYAWSNGSTLPSVTVNTAGTYTVTVSDFNGCSDTASHTLVVNPLPLPVITGPNVVCSGSFVTLSASGGSVYVWSNGSNTANANVSSPGTYTVSVTNAFGCFAQASHTLGAAQSPTASITGNLAYCAGGGTTITASGGGSYFWSTSSTNAMVSVTTPGTYTVTVTSANGCTDVTSVVVTENQSPPATIGGNSTICDGEISTLIASGGVGYSWSNGANTASMTTTVAGTYTVTVTDINGCNGTASISVLVNPNPPAPTITALGNTLASSNANAYQWYLAGNPIPGATGQFYQATQTGFYSVVVTINGCSSMSQPYPHTFVVGIGDSLSTGVKVFPNPNQGEFVVEFDKPTINLLQLNVTNVLGQVIYESMLEPNTRRISVHLNSVSDGVYLLEVLDSEMNQKSVFNLLIRK